MRRLHLAASPTAAAGRTCHDAIRERAADADFGFMAADFFWFAKGRKWLRFGAGRQRGARAQPPSPGAVEAGPECQVGLIALCTAGLVGLVRRERGAAEDFDSSGGGPSGVAPWTGGASQERPSYARSDQTDGLRDDFHASHPLYSPRQDLTFTGSSGAEGGASQLCLSILACRPLACASTGCLT